MKRKLMEGYKGLIKEQCDWMTLIMGPITTTGVSRMAKYKFKNEAFSLKHQTYKGVVFRV